MLPAKEVCRGRWLGILPQLGVFPRFLTGKQTPCPKCEGKNRFRFDDKEGRGTYFCNSCGAGDGFQLISLVTGMPNRDAIRRAVELARSSDFQKPKPMIDADKAHEAMLAIWRMSRPITPEDDAGKYLASRGLEIPSCDSLRFVPQLKLTNEQWDALPAMIARVRSDRGDSVNLHRTYLMNGRKAPITTPRKLMPSGKDDKDRGCHIELCAAAVEMGVAEGIETALGAAKLFSIPTWSAINTNYLEQFEPPKQCHKLHIFADNDDKYGGQKAAYALAHRLATRRNPIEIEVHMPGVAGTDWADYAEK